MGFEDVELLSGSPLSREQRVDSPADTDVFVISEPGFNSPDAIFYQSKHLTYNVLRQNIYQDISSGLRLGTMAFQDESNYARAEHDHFPKYVKAEFQPALSRNYDVSENDDTVVVIGHIMINGRSYDMCIPKINQNDVKIPEKPVGLLKFLARPRLSDIDENSPEFDGWTYPDGRFVSKTKFPQAYAAFKDITSEETATQFRLPDIRDFIELNPYVQPQNAFEKKPAVTGLPAHHHSITDMDISGSIEFDLYIKGYNTWKQKPGEYPEYKYHHGTMNDGSGAYISPEIQFNADNITLTMDGISENQAKIGENRPSYDLLPVLMYIGRPPGAVNTYTVTFNANGGKCSETSRYISQGSRIGTLPVPFQSGYSFIGWYTAAEGGELVTAQTAVASDITLYAQWTESSIITVTFNSNDEEIIPLRTETRWEYVWGHGVSGEADITGIITKATTFENYLDISSIYIGTHVTGIEGGAFYDFNYLQEVEIPEGISEIGLSAFQNCQHLRRLQVAGKPATEWSALPDSVTAIRNCAFENCGYLAMDGELRLGSRTTSIGPYAFCRCGSLTLRIPRGVTSIGENAFYNRIGISISTPVSAIIFEGRTMSEIQAISGYPWGAPTSAVIAGIA